MQVQWLIESIDQKIKLQGNESWQDEALHIHVTTAQMILGKGKTIYIHRKGRENIHEWVPNMDMFSRTYKV